MSEWEDIESAPKDGTVVITAKKAEWIKAYDHFSYPIPSKFVDGKWLSDFGDRWEVYDPQPTHWRPSPPAKE